MGKMKTSIAVLLAASVCPATVAYAASTDSNANAANMDAARQASDMAFSRWDANSNNRLENGEFARGLHDRSCTTGGAVRIAS